MTLFISLKLSSCLFCDKNLYLDGNKIIQEENYIELMSNKEWLYYEMFKSQAWYYKK